MRLIDKDALIDALMDYTWRDEEDAVMDDADEKRRFIEEWFPEVPTVDAVPVVRCKDCKWFEISHLKRDGTGDKRFKPSVCVNGTYAVRRRADWYCADGERREDNG